MQILNIILNDSLPSISLLSAVQVDDGFKSKADNSYFTYSSSNKVKICIIPATYKALPLILFV
ncbi:hypothetical protein SAMN04488511_104129 [Pedobacter suwonensis]|uniref:Uncharacterized protein n=1 Tax=Pedobacter suwonensis TaxID=332999 RepID=A0A1I0T0H5_9SPHI|nr:hypothetical protein SAMN04488511_104129 [Pedobacter suwonensis]